MTDLDELAPQTRINMHPQRIYIAGPMTGYPDFNYPAFHAAAKQLRDAGYAAINPADSLGGDTSRPYEYYIRIAISRLLQADMVAVLPGWEKSRGAKIEVAIAQTLNLPVVYMENMDPIPDVVQVDVADEEKAIAKT